MDDQLFLDVCTRQYKAVFDAVRGLLKVCPDALWDRREQEAPFWQQAYHILWWSDLYLSRSPQAFTPPEMGGGQDQDLGKQPGSTLSREQLMEYLKAVRAKFRARIKQLGAGGLDSENPFPWTGPTVAHHLVYNLRHAQHHCGWMASILRRNGAQPPRWICTG